MSWTQGPIAMIAVAVLVAGCGSSSTKTSKKEPPKPETPQIPAQTVNLAPGSSTIYGETGAKGHEARTPLWYVEWKRSASADLTSGGDVSQGAMEEVNGHLFQDGQPATQFQANRGRAGFLKAKAEGKSKLHILSLAGQVHMHSILGKNGKPIAKKSADGEEIDVYCDRVDYDAFAGLIRAQGHVRVVSRVGTIGPLSQLLISPDLRVVSTPDMFSADDRLRARPHVDLRSQSESAKTLPLRRQQEGPLR